MFLKMSIKNFGLLIILMVTLVKADMWKLPTAQDLQTAMDTCQLTYQYFINAHEENRSDSSEDIRCFAQELELWSDHEGFKIERVVKLLKKHNVSQEIEVVVDYCNNSRKQADLLKWANEAYACFAQGRLGLWIIEYIESAYKKKNNNV